MFLSSLIALSAAALDNPTPVDCAAHPQPALAAYAGDWDVAWTRRTAPGEYADKTAHATIAADLAGCAARETFRSQAVGENYFAEWTMAAHDDGALEAVWFDSGHGGFLSFEGVEAEEGADASLVWRHANGRMMVRYDLTPAADADGFTAERHLSTDAGETWALTSRGVYTRAAE